MNGEGGSTRVFNRVWYRDRPFYQPRNDWAEIPIHHETGTLTVAGTFAVFTSRTGRVRIENAHRMSFGRHRPDWHRVRWGRRLFPQIDPWVRVDYGDGQMAFLTDGRFFGWAGVATNNRPLREALSHLLRHE